MSPRKCDLKKGAGHLRFFSEAIRRQQSSLTDGSQMFLTDVCLE
jgi:hypothetical protein